MQNDIIVKQPPVENQASVQTVEAAVSEALPEPVVEAIQTTVPPKSATPVLAVLAAVVVCAILVGIAVYLSLSASL